jgi:hypothetical protein
MHITVAINAYVIPEHRRKQVMTFRDFSHEYVPGESRLHLTAKQIKQAVAFVSKRCPIWMPGL